MMKFEKIINKREVIAGILISFLFAYSLFFGFICHTDRYSFHISYPIIFILLWILFFLFIVLGWKLIDYLGNNRFNKKEADSTDLRREYENENVRKRCARFLVTFLLIFISWIPCWLASWPGFFSYDSGKEFVHIWYPEIPVWGRISILHSSLLWLSCKAGIKLFGTFNAGIALFTFFHLLLGAFVLAYETLFLYKQNPKKIVYILTMIYFMFSPTIALFSGCSNSTIFGSLLASLMIIRFYEIFCLEALNNKSKAKTVWGYASFAILVVLTCHIRTSFSMLFSLMLVYVIIKNLKQPKRIVYMILIFISIFVFNNAIIKLYKAENPPDSELYSIPVQQLANVYVKRGDSAFTPADKEVLLRYYAEEHFQWYCPWCADPIKLGLKDEEFNNHTKDFWKLWIQKGLEYPMDYFEAWNYLTYEAWYPFCEPDGYTRRNYIESDYRSDYFKDNIEAPAESEIKMRWLSKVIHWFSTEAYVHRLPLVGQICSIGFQYLILLFVVGYAVSSKRWQYWFINFSNLAYFVMMLFAPIVLVRYHLLLFYLFPVTLATLFYRENIITENN